MPREASEYSNLQIADRVSGVRTPQRHRPDLRQTNITNVTGFDQVAERVPDRKLFTTARRTP
jgi:hypothetical protein